MILEVAHTLLLLKMNSFLVHDPRKSQQEHRLHFGRVRAKDEDRELSKEVRSVLE